MQGVDENKVGYYFYDFTLGILCQENLIISSLFLLILIECIRIRFGCLQRNWEILLLKLAHFLRKLAARTHRETTQLFTGMAFIQMSK